MVVPILPKNIPIERCYTLQRKYGVFLVDVDKYYDKDHGNYYGVIRFGRAKNKFISKRIWNLYFEYPEESFRIFCKEIHKRQTTLYLCLKKQTLLPKEIIKMIVEPLWIYDGPFYGEKRPRPKSNRFKDEMILVVGFIILCLYVVWFWLALSKIKR